MDRMDGFQVLWPQGELASQAFQAADRVHLGEIQMSEARPRGCHGEHEHLAAPARSGVGGIDEPVHGGVADYAAVVNPEDLTHNSERALGERVPVDRLSLT